jgi:peroxiredoxin
VAISATIKETLGGLDMARATQLLQLISIAILFFAGAAVTAEPPDFQTLEIGAAAPDFELPGVDGKTHRLSDFADAELLMVVFTCNHCPTAQAYEERIMKLHEDYQDRGVALVAISPNDPLAVRLDELGYTDLSDSLEEMKIRAEDRGFKFPYLYDGETQKVSAAYGVIATPHVFIFDSARKLRYAGRIDDSEVKEVKSHDAKNALDALLAGRPVPVEKTRVFGCSTKWSDKREDATKSLEKWDQEPVELKLLDEAGLKELAANDTENYRLINVWATWCVPCVTELPEFVTMNRMYRRRNFEMITICTDNPEDREQALEVLRELHVSSTNYLFDSTDRDKLFDGLDPEWPGGIPYTVLIAPGGKVVFRIHASIDPRELKKLIADHLGRTY